MLLILLLTLLAFYIFYDLYWKRRSLPPGPTPFPIFGNLPTIFTSKAPGIEAFQNWSKQYGDVYTIWMGTTPTVVITSYQKLKETFVNDAETYIDRKIFRGFNDTIKGGDYGVFDTNGETWREHRRFALHSLRDFGMGKERMQDAILLEVDSMTHELSTSAILDINIQALFDISIGNIINQFLFGKRFEEKAQFYKIDHLIGEFSDEQGSMVAFFCYLNPWLPTRIVAWLTAKSVKCANGMYEFFDAQIAEHRKEINYDVEESEDYVETYLKEQRKREQLGDFESFNNDQLKNMCFDMWAAGMHTSTNTMGFMVAYAIRNPDCQRRMQEELTKVSGDRTVTMKDKLSLPYTNAFIQETQRLCNLIPINVTHATARPTIIDGYHIPKGVAIQHQISSLLWDPEVYPNPDQFIPSRFLDTTGNLNRSDEFLPFSIGRRVCLGEGLAKMELFLFAANLFNRFEFHPGSGGMPPVDIDFSFITRNAPYTCAVKQRYM